MLQRESGGPDLSQFDIGDAKKMGLPRRHFMTGGGAVLAGLATAHATSAAPAGGFGFRSVVDIARRAVQHPYIAPDKQLPKVLADLSYDAYRGIRFRKSAGLWSNLGVGFHAEFFHRGGLDTTRVDIFEVNDGVARPIAYSTDDFTFDPPLAGPVPADLGFAGFRIHAADIPGLDEVAVFLGASYFRAVAADIGYGLSARGLAIGTGDNTEEFPIFRSFWLERPKKGDKAVRLYAWLDSPSISGAYSFVITPGASTVFHVECQLYPRRDIADAGIAPLTSMFLFGPGDRRRVDDFRGAVHDSDGLQMTAGSGEAIWAPLTNPLQVEAIPFADRAPKGYGLMQRDTRVVDYEDYEAHYEKRPSAWVRPAGDWGEGAVRLYELPSNTEAFDNIVAFWRPTAPLRAGHATALRYDIVWGLPDIGEAGRPKGRVVQTRTGAGADGKSRMFIIDFDLPPVDLDTIKPQLTATAGAVGTVSLQKLDDAPGGLMRVRAFFGFTPSEVRSSDFKLTLQGGGAAATDPLAEAWMYRWTA